MIKLLETKGKATREKCCTIYRGRKIQMAMSFSSETKEARGQCTVYLIFKEKNRQLRILYPAKLCLRNKGEMKTFSEGKLRDSISSSRPALKDKSSSKEREMISVGNVELQE